MHACVLVVAGFVHQLENCLIGPKGEIKLCDFGLAHVHDDGTDTLQGSFGTRVYQVLNLRAAVGVAAAAVWFATELCNCNSHCHSHPSASRMFHMLAGQWMVGRVMLP